MKKQPLSVTILAWVFVAAGSIGLAAGLVQLVRVTSSVGTSALNRHYLIETVFILLSGLIATIGGAGLLHGFKWARWVCIVWMAFHVVLSIWHSMTEVAFHAAMLAGMIYILFRNKATARG